MLEYYWGISTDVFLTWSNLTLFSGDEKCPKQENHLSLLMVTKSI